MYSHTTGHLGIFPYTQQIIIQFLSLFFCRVRRQTFNNLTKILCFFCCVVCFSAFFSFRQQWWYGACHLLLFYCWFGVLFFVLRFRKGSENFLKFSLLRWLLWASGTLLDVESLFWSMAFDVLWQSFLLCIGCDRISLFDRF